MTFIKYLITWISENLSIPFWMVGHIHLSINVYEDIYEIIEKSKERQEIDVIVGKKMMEHMKEFFEKDEPVMQLNIHNKNRKSFKKANNCKTSNNCNITFYINNSYIITNINDSFPSKEENICIVYLGIPTDDEGLPLIPDDVYYQKALTSYVISMLDYQEWRKGKTPDKVYQKSEQDWLFYDW